MMEELKATIGIEGVQSTLNEHTKELAKVAQKRIQVGMHSKEEQEKTLKLIRERADAMNMEAKILSDLALTYQSFCEDYNKAKGRDHE